MKIKISFFFLLLTNNEKKKKRLLCFEMSEKLDGDGKAVIVNSLRTLTDQPSTMDIKESTSSPVNNAKTAY